MNGGLIRKIGDAGALKMQVYRCVQWGRLIQMWGMDGRFISDDCWNEWVLMPVDGVIEYVENVLVGDVVSMAAVVRLSVKLVAVRNEAIEK